MRKFHFSIVLCLIIFFSCTSCLLFPFFEKGYSQEQIRSILEKLEIPRIDPNDHWEISSPYVGTRSEWTDGPKEAGIKYHIAITGRDDNPGKATSGDIFVAGNMSHTANIGYQGDFSYSFNMEEYTDSSGGSHELYFEVDLETKGIDETFEITKVHYRHFTYDGRSGYSSVVRKLPLGTMDEKLLIQDVCLITK